jgi:hypothetical protein
LVVAISTAIPYLENMNAPRLIHIVGEAHERHIAEVIRLSETLAPNQVIQIAGDTVEAIDRPKVLQIKDEGLLLEAMKCPVYEHFPEPKEKFRDRWKGGNGPGSSAPMKRGKR